MENVGTESGSKRLIRPNPDLAKRIEEATGINPMDCYQCGKCSAGCPVGEVTDLLPHDFWRMAQLGMEEELLQSKHLWLCVACETCTTRCPNKLPLPTVIDYLRKTEIAKERETSEPDIVAFHKAFLEVVEKYGRMHEIGLMRKFKSFGELMADWKLGMAMFSRGKIKLFAKKVANRSEIRKMFEGVKK